MTVTRLPVADRLREIWGDDPGLAGFFKSVDHKRVGRRYLVTALTFLVLGGIQALIMRTQLAVPENDLVGPEVYNQIMTMHGTTMIFLFNTTIWSGFGNYFLPLQIGTRDMAFPRLNMLSYWIFLFSGLFIYSSFFVGSIPDGGWFAYVPLTSEQWSPSLGMDFWAVGLAFLGVSSTIGAVNFIVTTFKMRAPGMTVSRLPIFVWAVVVMAFMILLAFPAVTLAQVMLELDRSLGLSFFDPGAGGDPLLFQHLFWVWGHPEVYIVFVPATGVVSMIVAVFSRNRLVGHLLVATALVAIGFISFGVWVHHMFATGLGYLALSFFAAASFIVAIPSGVQFFAWIGTIWEGKPRFDVPMLWALGMMFIFLFGGITGVMVAMVPFDWQVQDSYFVVAHFHYTLVGGSVFPIFAALYYWFPKMTGRMANRAVGRWSFWLVFLGFNGTFFPLHVLGLWGMPRRVYTYQQGLGWDGINLFATVSAYVMALGFVLSLGNFVWSRWKGRLAPPNPWDADTLEWATASPTPTYNFAWFARVRSRYPVWDQPELADGRLADAVVPGEEPVLVPPGEEVEHYTMATGGTEADPEQVMVMPEPSYWPLILALGMTLGCYGVLIRQGAMSLAGVVVVLVALGGWFWPAYEPEEQVELAGEDREEVLS